MTKMISLDTSSKLSGWAYWEDAVLIDHGVIDMSGVKDPEDRLNRMCCSLTSLLADHTPDIVVIEMTVVTTNAKTQRILSEIVGAFVGGAYPVQITVPSIVSDPQSGVRRSVTKPKRRPDPRKTV